MNRFSLRKSHWIYLSLLTLVLAASSASAQMSVDVTAWASAVSPDWSPAPGDLSNPSTATMGASVADPPVPPYGCTLGIPMWLWNLDPNVQYSSDNSTWSQAPEDSYSALIVQSGSQATLKVTFNIGGYWQFPCNAGVWLYDSPCANLPRPSPSSTTSLLCTFWGVIVWKMQRELTKVITLQTEPKQNLRRPFLTRHPAAEALRRIGMPSIPAVMERLETAEDGQVVELGTRVIDRILGRELGEMAIKLAIDKQTDRDKRKKLEGALMFFKDKLRR